MRILNRVSQYGFAHQSRICIIGGGTGGVNVSAHLLRSKINPKEITIFQPSHYHYYQPGWTLVGSDMAVVETTRSLMENIIPEGVHLVKERVSRIKPKENLIITEKNHEYTYDQLIISSGLKLDWEKIKGAKQLLDDPLSKVCSIYGYDYAQKTAKLGNRHRGGKAIFTEPKHPIKCAGAPQKILYLLTKKWQSNHATIARPQFIKAQPVMFQVPKYNEALQKVAKSYKIKLTFQHNLVQVDQHKATFQHVLSKERIERQYDFLHLVPPMSAPTFIKQSGIGNQEGFVQVDDKTLRHVKYPNIWALGDSSSLPCSKTAAAVYSQTQVLIKNLLAVLKNPQLKELPSKYNGYGSCPLFTGDGKVILAQFLYDNKIDETFFNDQQKPRRIFYYLTKYWFPFTYWKLMPRGLWNGKDGLRFY